MKDKRKERVVDRETQLLTQDYSAALTNQNAQISPQKININSPYAKISKRNLNQTGEILGTVATIKIQRRFQLNRKQLRQRCKAK